MKSTDAWKLNNTLLNEEIMGEIKFLEANENENTT
jgi:hypothetical protein